MNPPSPHCNIYLLIQPLLSPPPSLTCPLSFLFLSFFLLSGAEALLPAFTDPESAKRIEEFLVDLTLPMPLFDIIFKRGGGKGKKGKKGGKGKKKK